MIWLIRSAQTAVWRCTLCGTFNSDASTTCIGCLTSLA